MSQEGDLGDFGIVKYDPRASFNILSIDSLPDGTTVMYDHASRRHTVLLNNITYHFDVPLGAKGFPIQDFHVQPNSVSHVHLNTVSQNKATHTHRQVIEAKRASLQRKTVSNRITHRSCGCMQTSCLSKETLYY